MTLMGWYSNAQALLAEKRGPGVLRKWELERAVHQQVYQWLMKNFKKKLCRWERQIQQNDTKYYWNLTWIKTILSHIEKKPVSPSK